MAASGTETVVGTLAVTENPDTLNASGSGGTIVVTAPGTVGSGAKNQPHPDTLAYWQSEAERLAAIRDDEEVLCLI